MGQEGGITFFRWEWERKVIRSGLQPRWDYRRGGANRGYGQELSNHVSRCGKKSGTAASTDGGVGIRGYPKWDPPGVEG